MLIKQNLVLALQAAGFSAGRAVFVPKPYSEGSLQAIFSLPLTLADVLGF